jgi:site-specific recombinase XerD
MDPSNFRKRILHQLAEELELPKLTFQVVRRTIATRAEGDVKGLQGMMQHPQISTTTNVYMQVLRPEVRSTVDSIHKQLSRKPVPATPPEP